MLIPCTRYVFLKIIYLFIWLLRVLAVAHGIFVAARGLLSSCGVQAPECVGLVTLWHVGS